MLIPALIRMILLGTTRLFYKEIAVSGELPDGPLVIVANHPNGLVDPLLIRLASTRTVSSMAKSSLFENPFGRAAMEAFDALPVYRRVDGEDTSQNDSMFAACQACLEEGGAMMLFPEGVSHSEPRLLPLKTGAARIALQAEGANDFSLGVRVLPVGLIYEDKAIFRTRAAVVIGAPVSVSDYASLYAEDRREAARALTHEISDALGTVMLEAEDNELWGGFLAVARWMSEDAAMEVHQERARELAAGYRWLAEHEPTTAQQLVDDVRSYAQMFESVGVKDPLDMERTEVKTISLIAAALWLLLLSPFALLGFILGWLPYRLIRPLSFAIARGDLDIVSSIKAIAGLALMPLTYLLEAALASYFIHWGAGLAVLLAGPLLGLVAMHFTESLARRRAALHTLWLRATRESITTAIAARRAELAARITTLMDRYARERDATEEGEP